MPHEPTPSRSRAFKPISPRSSLAAPDERHRIMLDGLAADEVDRLKAHAAMQDRPMVYLIRVLVRQGLAELEAQLETNDVSAPLGDAE